MYVCMYVCIYVSMYVCMYMGIWIENTQCFKEWIHSALKRVLLRMYIWIESTLEKEKGLLNSYKYMNRENLYMNRVLWRKKKEFWIYINIWIERIYIWIESTFEKEKGIGTGDRKPCSRITVLLIDTCERGGCVRRGCGSAHAREHMYMCAHVSIRICDVISTYIHVMYIKNQKLYVYAYVRIRVRDVISKYIHTMYIKMKGCTCMHMSVYVYAR